jgi:hypothetical protein
VGFDRGSVADLASSCHSNSSELPDVNPFAWKGLGMATLVMSTRHEETNPHCEHRRAQRAQYRVQKLLEEADEKAAASAGSHLDWCCSVAHQLDLIPEDPWDWLLDQPDAGFL